MSIVAFWSNEKKETGQTLSMVALSTYMAIEHNYKILNLSTNFKDETIEKCYWDLVKNENLVKTITSQQQSQVAFESGVEWLIKIINSNKTSNSIISNYTKIVFKNRLDVLCSPKTDNYDEYSQICKFYPNILQVANRNYDIVFIDVSKDMPEEISKAILEMSDVIMINMTQKMETIDNFIELRQNNEFFNKRGILLNIGRYDKFSKYNIKNISRYMKEKKDIDCIPYNTLFFEACSEGKVAELFLRLRKLDPEDRNAVFIDEIARMTKDLLYKLQELQMKL